MIALQRSTLTEPPATPPSEVIAPDPALATDADVTVVPRSQGEPASASTPAAPGPAPQVSAMEIPHPRAMVTVFPPAFDVIAALLLAPQATGAR